MNTLHTKALTKLTADWQPLNALKDGPHDGSVVYDDLVAAGLAQVKREPIVRHGIQCGERVFFCLA